MTQSERVTYISRPFGGRLWRLFPQIAYTGKVIVILTATGMDLQFTSPMVKEIQWFGGRVWTFRCKKASA